MIPDLDSVASIDELVEDFYAAVLTDPVLRPVFVEVAEIDLSEHLPRIKAYWRRMLLGHDEYHHNMVARHQALQARFALQPRHFKRWLGLFEKTVDRDFTGPGAERAKRLARTVAANLQSRLRESSPCGSFLRVED